MVEHATLKTFLSLFFLFLFSLFSFSFFSFLASSCLMTKNVQNTPYTLTSPRGF